MSETDRELKIQIETLPGGRFSRQTTQQRAEWICPPATALPEHLNIVKAVGDLLQGHVGGAGKVHAADRVRLDERFQQNPRSYALFLISSTTSLTCSVRTP